MRVPSASAASRDSSNKRDTAAMVGSASPRKPSVAMERRSSADLSLLVAWRSNASNASSWAMPWPSSMTRIIRLPPDSISIRMVIAPASRAFSSSSFTTEAGRSTTSPAAILLATASGSMRMRDIETNISLFGENDFHSLLERGAFGEPGHGILDCALSLQKIRDPGQEHKQSNHAKGRISLRAVAHLRYDDDQGDDDGSHVTECGGRKQERKLLDFLQLWPFA